MAVHDGGQSAQGLMLPLQSGALSRRTERFSIISISADIYNNLPPHVAHQLLGENTECVLDGVCDGSVGVCVSKLCPNTKGQSEKSSLIFLCVLYQRQRGPPAIWALAKDKLNF